MLIFALKEQQRTSLGKESMKMALIRCPECTSPVSSSADACPKCGYLFSKTEYQFIEVYSAEGILFGQGNLNSALENGWQVAGTHEFVDDEGVEVTKYNLARRVSTLG